MAEYTWLKQRLRELHGPALRFHSSVIEPVIGKVRPQIPWLEEHLGTPFTEDLYQYDGDVCIRTESDLFKFDPETLTWLAAAVHSKPVHPAVGEAAASAVAAQMHILRQHLPPKVRVRRFIGKFLNGLRRR